MTGISTSTLAKLSKNENVGMEVLEKICITLNCQPGDIRNLINDYENIEDKSMEDIIEFHYRGLKEFDNEKGYLIDTCLNGQDTYQKMMDYYEC